MTNLFDENFFNNLSQNITENLIYTNYDVMRLICERLYKIGKSTSLKTSVEYATADLQTIKKEIDNNIDKNQKEIDKIVEESANTTLAFVNTFFAYRGMKQLKSYKDDDKLTKIVNSIKAETIKDYKNISKTQGFLINGKFNTIRQQYISIIDEGIIAVRDGYLDYNTAIRNSVIKMINSGIRTIDFKSGYSRRLDSQIRMNILEGVRKLNMEVLNTTSKQFGADGYEITAHSLCAPDHQHIQGKQYSKKEYERLNKKLKRPIGTLNCKHIAIPIILGVSKPTYSDDELEKIINKSNQKVKYNDKIYTRYEASQQQRKLENLIRKEKEKLNLFKILNDDLQIKKTKDKITELTNLYKTFSNAVGLSIYPEKLKIYN